MSYLLHELLRLRKQLESKSGLIDFFLEFSVEKENLFQLERKGKREYIRDCKEKYCTSQSKNLRLCVN